MANEGAVIGEEHAIRAVAPPGKGAAAVERLFVVCMLANIQASVRVYACVSATLHGCNPSKLQPTTARPQAQRNQSQPTRRVRRGG